MAKLGGGTAGYTYAWHNQLYVKGRLGVAQPAICLAQPAVCLAQPALSKGKVVGWHSRVYAWHSRLYGKAKLWGGTAGYMLGTAGYMVVACEILLSALGLFRFSILDSQSQSQSQSQSLDNTDLVLNSKEFVPTKLSLIGGLGGL